MIHPIRKFITPEEYLAREAKSEFRSEYRNGEIVALAGGSLNHNRIARNASQAFDRALAKKQCEVFVHDVRVHMPKDNQFAYPDVMVVCGKIEFATGRDDTVKNPTLIIEVLSDSTQAYDRGEKFSLYRRIPSLQHYVMIDQTRAYVEHYRRENRFWVFEALEGMNVILQIKSLGCKVSLKTLYAKVKW